MEEIAVVDRWFSDEFGYPVTNGPIYVLRNVLEVHISEPIQYRTVVISQMPSLSTRDALNRVECWKFNRAEELTNCALALVIFCVFPGEGFRSVPIWLFFELQPWNFVKWDWGRTFRAS